MKQQGVSLRPTPVPEELRPELAAATAVNKSIPAMPATVQAAFGPDHDHKHTEKQLKDKESKQLFRDLQVVFPVVNQTYQAEVTGKKTLLPSQDIVDNAPGLIGAELRRLCQPSLQGVKLVKADVDALYAAYNQTTWIYNCTIAPAPQQLILGHTNVAVCGALAGALMEMVRIVAELRQVDNPATKASIPKPFVSKPYQFGFIDPKVKGNIYSIEPLNTTGKIVGYNNVNRVRWSTHTWMVAFSTAYDPLGKQSGFDFQDTPYGNPDTADRKWKAVPLNKTTDGDKFPPWQYAFDKFYRLVEQQP